MKEKYEMAEITVIAFENDDVIVTSVDIGPYDTPFQPAE